MSRSTWSVLRAVSDALHLGPEGGPGDDGAVRVAVLVVPDAPLGDEVELDPVDPGRSGGGSAGGLGGRRRSGRPATSRRCARSPQCRSGAAGRTCWTPWSTPRRGGPWDRPTWRGRPFRTRCGTCSTLKAAAAAGRARAEYLSTTSVLLLY